jgi:hypothetical protein
MKVARPSDTSGQADRGKGTCLFEDIARSSLFLHAASSREQLYGFLLTCGRAATRHASIRCCTRKGRRRRRLLSHRCFRQVKFAFMRRTVSQPGAQSVSRGPRRRGVESVDLSEHEIQASASSLYSHSVQGRTVSIGYAYSKSIFFLAFKCCNVAYFSIYNLLII